MKLEDITIEENPDFENVKIEVNGHYIVISDRGITIFHHDDKPLTRETVTGIEKYLTTFLFLKGD